MPSLQIAYAVDKHADTQKEKNNISRKMLDNPEERAPAGFRGDFDKKARNHPELKQYHHHGKINARPGIRCVKVITNERTMFIESKPLSNFFHKTRPSSYFNTSF